VATKKPRHEGAQSPLSVSSRRLFLADDGQSAGCAATRQP
jgi:hypothetical protein